MWLLLTLLLGVAIYWHLNKPYGYWKERGVFHLKPVFIFGNIKERLLGRISFHDCTKNLYKQFKGHRYAGFFEGNLPILMMLDIELIKYVLVRDHDYFVDRPFLHFNSSPHINKMLVSLKGSEWKYMRGIMVPGFSPTLLKFQDVQRKVCANQMSDYIEQIIKQMGENKYSKAMEMKDFFGRYTTDVTVSSLFSVQYNSFRQQSDGMYENLSKFFDIGLLNKFFLCFSLMFIPKLCCYFPVRLVNSGTLDFIAGFVEITRLHRLKNLESQRNDFFQFLIDKQTNEIENLKNLSKSDGLNDDCNISSGKLAFNNIINEDMIVAQFVLLLFAGFETTSTLLAFASYELALHPDIQTKLRAEISAISDKYDGEFSYTSISEMNYLEMVLNETLRKYPVLGRIDRVCTKKYQIPGSELVINPGQFISIPVTGIHCDPEYYPDPENFDPERFSLENRNKRSLYTFLPFGRGPKNCIGLRFAMLIAKSAMAHILSKYKFTICENTKIPLKFNNCGIFLTVESGIWLKIEKL